MDWSLSEHLTSTLPCCPNQRYNILINGVSSQFSCQSIEMSIKIKQNDIIWILIRNDYLIRYSFDTIKLSYKLSSNSRSLHRYNKQVRYRRKRVNCLMFMRVGQVNNSPLLLYIIVILLYCYTLLYINGIELQKGTKQIAHNITIPLDDFSNSVYRYNQWEETLIWQYIKIIMIIPIDMHSHENIYHGPTIVMQKL